MAYGRRRKYNKPKGLANLPNGKTANRAVKRVYRKAKVVPKRKTAINKAAIMTLARQVKNLQNQRYGEIQTCIDVYNAQGSFPNRANPCCFAINDFYHACPMYRGTLLAGVPGFNLAGNFNRMSYESDMNDQYEWCARLNSDQVSSIQYKPVSTRLDFEFWFDNVNSLLNQGELRVTLLKVKPIQLEGSVDCSLPSRLGAYRNLCSEASDTKTNYFSPRLHEVLYDKRVKVDTTKFAHLQSGIKQKIKFSIPYTFRTGHVITPDFTTLPAGQVFINSVPQTEIIWCMISANEEAHNLFAAYGMKIRRFMKWRDRDGVQG